MKYLILMLTIMTAQAQDFYIFAGQSNMQGYGLVEELKMSDFDNQNIYGWNWSTNSWVHNPNPVSDVNVFHAERLDGLIIHDLTDNFGCELSALRVLRDKTNKPVYFIKYAVGASGLNEWANTYWNRINSEIQLTGRTPSAMFWMQGETDAGYYGSSSTYKTRLSDFIDQVGLSFYAGQISQRWSYADVVRQAIYDLNKENKLSMIGTDYFSVYRGLDSHPDGLNTAHYDSDSLRRMGIKFALSYLYCQNSNRYPEVIGDFDGDGHTDLLMIEPFSGIKQFKVWLMQDYSLLSINYLYWQGVPYYQIADYFVFNGVTDPDNDGDDDISHTEGTKQWIWRIDFPHITHSEWKDE